VEDADEVVQDDGARPSARLGEAVRDLDRDFLVLAQQHRRLVAPVVDQRVVQAAEARARIEREILEAVLLDEIDDHVGLPTAKLPVRVIHDVGPFVNRGVDR
jgi:hypothetical protein